MAKTKFENLNAPSNNVKLQSDKTLPTKIYFFNYTSDGIFSFWD